MRVAFFTPSDARSAIAEYSRHMADALRRHVDVELWSHDGHRAPADAPPDVDFGADPSTLDGLSLRDVALYSFGNHLDYHGPIYDVASTYPGVVQLHDRSLHHFFAARYKVADDIGGYLDRLAQLYGPSGRLAGREFVAGERAASWADVDDLQRFDFLEDAVAGHYGAVVHSHSHAADVRARWHGPVAELFLPTYPIDLACPPLPPVAREPVTVVTAGDVNRNKHIDKVIGVLAEDFELAQRVRYLVVGRLHGRDEYSRELAAQIADAGLAGTVALLGRQSPVAYKRLIATADVFVNLRFPSIEGGSATLMGQLARGRPVVTYEAGVYAELPAESVVRVPVGDATALREQLRRLVDDPAARATLGANGRTFAEARTVEAYADALAAFLDEARTWRPRLELADRVGRELSQLGISTDDPLVERTAERLARLLPLEPALRARA